MVSRVALIVALAGFLAAFQVVHVRALLSDGPVSMFPIEVKDGELIVRDVSADGGFLDTARFHRAGLQKGDIVEAAYTDRGEGGRVDNLLALFDVARKSGGVRTMTLQVRRPSAGHRRLEVVVPPLPDLQRATFLLALGWTVLVPLAALTAALLLGLLKPEDTRAFVGSLMFLALAGALTLDTLSLPPAWAVVLWAGQSVAFYGANLLFLWFFLIFPTASPIERRLPWLKYTALAVTVLSAMLAATLEWALVTSFALYERLRTVFAEAWVGPVLGVCAGALILTGIVSLVLNTRRLKSRDERHRMRIILVGTLVGLGPLLVVDTFYSMQERFPPLPVAALVVALLSMFPISFVYAVVRHRVLGIRLILRRGVQYALVSAGFRLLLGAAVFAVFAVGLASSATPIRRDPVTSVLIAAAVAFVVARVFRSVSRRVMSHIDRRFFRDAYDARAVLSSLSHTIRQLLLDRDRLLNDVVGSVSEALHLRTAAIFLREGDQGDGAGVYRCAALRCDEGVQIDAASLELPEAGLLVARLRRAEDAARVRTLDVFLDEPRGWAHALIAEASHAGERAVLERLGVQLAVPIMAGARLVGLMLLGDKRSEEHYSRDDRELLVTVAEQVGLALDYGELARQAAREESFRKEVEIASSVQARLFPQTLPPVSGVDYAGICRPAREIGGDSYDFIALEPNRLGVAVGDISGKGVAAALLMANLQALLRSHAPLRGDDLRDLMADINRLLIASIPDNRFATFFYGVLDPSGRRLTYVNAGHNPPMLLRTDSGASASPPAVVRLDPTGTMLGMFSEIAFEQREVRVSPGDVLLAYSDGVCDALNEKGEDYGDQRLEAVVRANAGLTAACLQDRILDDVAAFGGGVAPFDDMTLVVAKLV